MRSLLFIAAAALGLSGCVSTTTSTTAAYPENVQTTACFSGGYAFSFQVAVPQQYGSILAMTQHQRSSTGLTSVCRLTGGNGSYQAFSGEVANGGTGMCISARTRNAGHVISCASQSEVRRALNAPAYSGADVINFTQWSPYPG